MIPPKKLSYMNKIISYTRKYFNNHTGFRQSTVNLTI